MVQYGPLVVRMVVAHLNVAEMSAELTPRLATLLGILDKLAAGFQEEQ